MLKKELKLIKHQQHNFPKWEIDYNIKFSVYEVGDLKLRFKKLLIEIGIITAVKFT